jgi:hypothetical protein
LPLFVCGIPEVSAVNISIILPSSGYTAQAGVRIRYKRIEPPLQRQGYILHFVPIDAIKSEADLAPGVVLFSKCQDARAVALAELAQSSGHVVGLDLFDDYFSQVADARFSPQRHWLASMARFVSFYLTSTERMAAVARIYMPDTPALVLRDPFDRFDADRIASDLREKREKCLSSQRINFLWFGIGDNPNFPVGLEDLAGQAEALRHFRRCGYDVELKILTNERALNADGLALLRRLGVPFSLDRWSLEAEAMALAESFASFIPVNAQPFSIAKSLNRAVTAIAAGNQVLSTGYPLYSPLSGHVYSDWASMAADLQSDDLRVRPSTLRSIASKLDELANPEREAESLAGFLGQFAPPATLAERGPPSRMPGNIAVMHGFLTNSAVHKFAQQFGWLSLGTPLTPAGLAFDAHLGFFGDERLPGLRLSKRAPKLINPQFKRLLQSAPASLGKGGPFFISDADGSDKLGLRWLSRLSVGSMAERAAFRDQIMEHSRQAFEQLFGDLNIVESEMDPSLQPSGLYHFSAPRGQ